MKVKNFQVVRVEGSTVSIPPGAEEWEKGPFYVFFLLDENGDLHKSELLNEWELLHSLDDPGDFSLSTTSKIRIS